ncbi:MAG: type II/IV secretion system protein, partial [Burkholderiales bacterium]|nr:type II/IV secretion system protein [Burkholderiales bacterium]
MNAPVPPSPARVPAAAAAGPRVDGPLTLNGLLADLVTDGLTTAEVADELLRKQGSRRSDAHPLVLLADQKWPDPRHPKKLLHLEALAEWLAGKVGLPYLHIDPFKIDFAAVTKVMSNAYASRFRILPVAVNGKEVTIATCEPFVRDWETELARALRLEIRRVIASPVDIATYL